MLSIINQREEQIGRVNMFFLIVREKIKFDIMVKCNIAKYSQHPNLKKVLLDTGDAILMEDSKVDYCWGIGADGTGQNLLGKALMEVRTKLREGDQ